MLFPFKRTYQYLGDEDSLLTSRANARCAGADIGFTEGAAADITDANGDVRTGVIEPKLCKLTDTTAMVVYRNSGGTTIYANIATIDSDLEVTFAGEITAVSGTSILGMSLLYLSDNKVLMCWQEGVDNKGVVLNVSGSTITPATEYTLNSTAQGSNYTSPTRIRLVDSGKVLLAYRNSDNGKASAQILEIDGSDVITFGTVAKSADITLTNQNVTVLSTAKAVMSSKTASKSLVEVITISGTTVTFDGTSYLFPNTTQLPSPTTSSVSQVYITPGTSAATASIIASITTGSPTEAAHIASWVLGESSGVLTSTTILQQTDEDGTFPNGYTRGNNTIFTYRKSSPGGLGLLVNNISSGTPVPVQQEEFTADTSAANAECDHIASGTGFVVYEISTTGLKGQAFNLQE